MARKNETDLMEEALAAFGLMDFAAQRDYLKQLQEAHQGALDARRQALMAELSELGGIPVPTARRARQVVDGERVRATPRAKYRSKANPELTYSGRGRMATWLEKEMVETGLPKEAFLIEPE
jgi:DNA-binding protein H-NS